MIQKFKKKKKKVSISVCLKKIVTSYRQEFGVDSIDLSKRAPNGALLRIPLFYKVDTGCPVDLLRVWIVALPTPKAEAHSGPVRTHIQ